MEFEGYQSDNGHVVTQADLESDAYNNQQSLPESRCTNFCAYLLACITYLTAFPFVILFGPTVYTLMSTANSLNKSCTTGTLQILVTIGAAIGGWKASAPLAEKITGADIHKEFVAWQYICICLFFSTLSAAIATKTTKIIKSCHDSLEEPKEPKNPKLDLVGFFKNCFQESGVPYSQKSNIRNLRINAG